jgi:hypothetical protein
MKKREQLAEIIGKYEIGCTPEDLARMREDG